MKRKRRDRPCPRLCFPFPFPFPLSGGQRSRRLGCPRLTRSGLDWIWSCRKARRCHGPLAISSGLKNTRIHAQALPRTGLCGGHCHDDRTAPRPRVLSYNAMDSGTQRAGLFAKAAEKSAVYAADRQYLREAYPRQRNCPRLRGTGTPTREPRPPKGKKGVGQPFLPVPLLPVL